MGQSERMFGVHRRHSRETREPVGYTSVARRLRTRIEILGNYGKLARKDQRGQRINKKMESHKTNNGRTFKIVPVVFKTLQSNGSISWKMATKTKQAKKKVK